MTPHYLYLNVQRNYIKDLELRLVAKDRENMTLSRDLAQMENTHKQTTNKHREALDKAAKK